MTKEEILEKLKENKALLQKRYGVEQIGLFGSYARDEANEESDIDIFVHLREPKFRYIAGLWNFLEELYNKKIDLFREYDKMRNKESAIYKYIKEETIFV